MFPVLALAPPPPVCPPGFQFYSAQGCVPNPSQSLSEEAAALVFEGSEVKNQGNLKLLNYTGDCPGKLRYFTKVRFKDANFPPASGLRVLLTNLSSTGENAYTDREYDKSNVSEAADAILGNSHEMQYFNLIEGQNKLSYKIYSGDSILKTGFLNVLVSVQRSSQDRPATWEEETVCYVKGFAKSDCADLRIKRSYVCPSGNILSSYFDPNTPAIKTSIVNTTNSPLSLYFNGFPLYLYPGQEYSFYAERYSVSQVILNGQAINLVLGKKNRIQETGSYGSQVKSYSVN